MAERVTPRRPAAAVTVALLIGCLAALLATAPVTASWQRERPLGRLVAGSADVPSQWERDDEDSTAVALLDVAVDHRYTRMWHTDRLLIVQTLEDYASPNLASAAYRLTVSANRAPQAGDLDVLRRASGGLPAGITRMSYAEDWNNANGRSITAHIQRGQYLEEIAVRRIYRSASLGGDEAKRTFPLTTGEVTEAVQRLDTSVGGKLGGAFALPWHVVIWLVSAGVLVVCLRRRLPPVSWPAGVVAVPAAIAGGVATGHWFAAGAAGWLAAHGVVLRRRTGRGPAGGGPAAPPPYPPPPLRPPAGGAR